MSASRRSRSRRYQRVLANLFVCFLGIVTVLLLVGLFLPRSYRVDRRVEIQAPAAKVYENLSSLRKWPDWTVWNAQRDPSVQFSFESPDSGVGAVYRWEGKTLGRGHLKLTRAEAAKGVSYELEINDGEMRGQGTLSMELVGQGVRVVWAAEGDLGKSPINRYVGLFMDRILGGELEASLANLKRQSEEGAR